MSSIQQEARRVDAILIHRLRHRSNTRHLRPIQDTRLLDGDALPLIEEEAHTLDGRPREERRQRLNSRAAQPHRRHAIPVAITIQNGEPHRDRALTINRRSKHHHAILDDSQAQQARAIVRGILWNPARHMRQGRTQRPLQRSPRHDHQH